MSSAVATGIRRDLAYFAAEAVYARPKDGEAVASLPGFVVDHVFNDDPCRSGFLAAGFRRRDDAALIFAIAGSDEPKDFAACANLGVCQYQSNRDAMLRYLCDHEWRRITLAGHSLGGALCQYLAYDLVHERPDFAERLLTFTFNGLGGRCGIERMHGSLDPALLARIAAVHFAHPEDEIPRIIAYLGELHLIPDIGPGLAPLVECHSIRAFRTAEGRLALDEAKAFPHLPLDIEETARRLGPQLGAALRDWVEGRRLRAARKVMAQLPKVPWDEWPDVLELLARLARRLRPFLGTGERVRSRLRGLPGFVGWRPRR